MKIQHIRNDKNQVVATLAAIKNEKTNTVGIGFAVVRPGDSQSKKFGRKIAEGRAMYRTSKVVPKKIEDVHREFVTHRHEVREFSGCKIPVPEDFQYSFEPLTPKRPDWF